MTWVCADCQKVSERTAKRGPCPLRCRPCRVLLAQRQQVAAGAARRARKGAGRPLSSEVERVRVGTGRTRLAANTHALRERVVGVYGDPYALTLCGRRLYEPHLGPPGDEVTCGRCLAGMKGEP